jgi:hypothetical protein
MGMAATASSYERGVRWKKGRRSEKKGFGELVAASRVTGPGVFFLSFWKNKQTEGMDGVVTSTGFHPNNGARKVPALRAIP